MIPTRLANGLTMAEASDAIGMHFSHGLIRRVSRHCLY